MDLFKCLLKEMVISVPHFVRCGIIFTSLNQLESLVRRTMVMFHQVGTWFRLMVALGLFKMVSQRLPVLSPHFPQRKYSHLHLAGDSMPLLVRSKVQGR